MKKIIIVALITLTCLIFVAVAGYFAIGNPLVAINNAKLKKAVKAIDGEYVYINDITDFEWDTLYTFAPYQSRESIEETIGFKSNDIKVNKINEGMVHLLFVKNQTVVASVLDYDSNLGYSIDFNSKITYAQNARFAVTRTNGIVNLTLS